MRNYATLLGHLALPLLALAGPLTPPPGPVAPTAKPLAEVEPRIAINATNTPGDADSLFKITQPGSYYLTGNITGVVGKHGIEITASGVTLDLNGFDLVGVPAMGFFDGVAAGASGLKGLAVLNGSIRNWGSNGVDLETGGAKGCRVEGVRTSGNSSVGIFIGSETIVRNCTSTGDAGGILTGFGCAISDCIVASSTVNGVFIGPGSVISRCSVYNNASTGVGTGTGCAVSQCSVYANGGDGISVEYGSTVTDCTTTFNNGDGIRWASNCTIRSNTSTADGLFDGAGVHATGNNNRIEGNTCSDADRGVHVDGTRNIIIRNTCSGNTGNWVIAANNLLGPILDRSAPASAGIVGNSAPGNLSSTDPNANFTF